MYKVITVTSSTAIVDIGADFKESEYPILNQYLKEGYVVEKVIPIIKPADQDDTYAITFVLAR
jgi:hypothetical protein